MKNVILIGKRKTFNWKMESVQLESGKRVIKKMGNGNQKKMSVKLRTHYMKGGVLLDKVLYIQND